MRDKHLGIDWMYRRLWNQIYYSPKSFFFHEDTRSHTENLIKELLMEFGWDLSPDLTLATSKESFCIWNLSLVVSQLFKNDDELNESVTTWLKTQATSIYKEGIEQFVQWYNKRLGNYESYIDKISVKDVHFCAVICFPVFNLFISKQNLLSTSILYFSIWNRFRLLSYGLLGYIPLLDYNTKKSVTQYSQCLPLLIRTVLNF